MTNFIRRLISIFAVLASLLLIMSVWTGFAIYKKGPLSNEIKETVREIFIHQKATLINIKDLSSFLIQDAIKRSSVQSEGQTSEDLNEGFKSPQVATDIDLLQPTLETEEVTKKVEEDLTENNSNEITTQENYLEESLEQLLIIEEESLTKSEQTQSNDEELPNQSEELLLKGGKEYLPKEENITTKDSSKVLELLESDQAEN